MRMLKRFALLPLLCVLAAAATGMDFDLVKDGKPASCIVLDKNFDATTAYAALELANYLEKITGARVPIRDVKDVNSYNVYLVVRGSQEVALPEAVKKPCNLIKDDGFVLAAGKDGVYVVGATPRGVLYGAYEILKKCGDVRWLMPGPDGEYCPRRATFSVPEQVTLVNPSFKLRRFNLVCGGARQDTYEWLLRNNMMISGRREGYGFEKYSPWVQAGGHIFSTLLPDTLFDTKPELFGLYKGKRTPQSGRLDIEPGKHQLGGQANQPCTSNPETVRIMCENLVKLLGKTPKAESFCILNNDSTAWCECENCKKLDPPAERARGLVNTRYWTLANQLVEAGKKEFPKVDFAVSAYQTFQEPPTGIAPDTRVTVDFCLHHRCYLHSVGDERCELNKRYRDILAQWRALGMPVSTYEYTNCLPHGEVMYLPLENVLAQDLKYYKKIGDFGYCDEVPPFDPQYDAKSPWNNRVIKESWRANWLAIYMKACFMWNADTDFDTVFEDVGSKFYGKAWPQMKKYKTLLREAYEKTDSHFLYGTPSATLGKCLDGQNVRKQLNELLDEAVKAASDDPALLKKISMEKEYFQLSWEAMRKEYEALQTVPVKAVKIGKAIVVDGNLDKAEWKQAAPVSGFMVFEKKNEMANPQTSVKVLYDEENLYLGIEAMEPTPDKVAATTKAHDDPAIWKDGNLLEFFIAPPALGIKYAHLAINTAGVCWDSMTYSPLNSDLKYDSGAEIKTKMLKDRWTMEVRIPFSSLGGKPKNKEGWKINVARGRKVEGAEGQLSSWSNGAFHGVDSYRSVIFGAD